MLRLCSCVRLGLLDLSILIRHEGGCYDPTLYYGPAQLRFQSSSATKADATTIHPDRQLLAETFNPHPPRRRMLLERRVNVGENLVLSILIRHEGGCYVREVVVVNVLVVFQSSSATKADATNTRTGSPRATRTFNPHPPRRRMLRSIPARGPIWSCAFNPHPPRRRMLPGTPAEDIGSDIFQSSSATKADATSCGYICGPLSGSFNPHPPRRRMLLDTPRDTRRILILSILIRHEGGCYEREAPKLARRRELSILIRHEGGCYALDCRSV